MERSKHKTRKDAARDCLPTATKQYHSRPYVAVKSKLQCPPVIEKIEVVQMLFNEQAWNILEDEISPTSEEFYHYPENLRWETQYLLVDH